MLHDSNVAIQLLSLYIMLHDSNVAIKLLPLYIMSHDSNVHMVQIANIEYNQFLYILTSKTL